MRIICTTAREILRIIWLSNKTCKLFYMKIISFCVFLFTFLPHTGRQSYQPSFLQKSENLTLNTFIILPKKLPSVLCRNFGSTNLSETGHNVKQLKQVISNHNHSTTTTGPPQPWWMDKCCYVRTKSHRHSGNCFFPQRKRLVKKLIQKNLSSPRVLRNLCYYI